MKKNLLLASVALFGAHFASAMETPKSARLRELLAYPKAKNALNDLVEALLKINIKAQADNNNNVFTSSPSSTPIAAQHDANDNAQTPIFRRTGTPRRIIRKTGTPSPIKYSIATGRIKRVINPPVRYVPKPTAKPKKPKTPEQTALYRLNKAIKEQGLSAQNIRELTKLVRQMDK